MLLGRRNRIVWRRLFSGHRAERASQGPGAVAVTNGGRTVAIGFTPELLGVHDDAATALDADSDTIPDMQEIWENLISIVFSAPPDAS